MYNTLNKYYEILNVIAFSVLIWYSKYLPEIPFVHVMVDQIYGELEQNIKLTH